MSVLLRCAAAALLMLACSNPALPADLVLDVKLDPSTRRFDAIAEVAATDDVTFTLHRGLSVRNATVDGRPVKLIARVPFDKESFVWRLTGARGTKVRVEYGGVLPALDRARDHRGVLGGIPPMTSPEGSFLPGGSGWYPQPRGLFTYAVTLSVPAEQRALVAGTLVSESTDADRYVARFEFDQPADGIDLMAGPYIVREKQMAREGKEPLRVRTYFTREIEHLADAYLDDSARYIALYSKQIGAYPYAGFSVVASPLPTGFGMPTLTYLGAQVLKLPFIRATSLGHEVLHNWWGNGVHVDYASGNWSEGLTTFMADYHYRERDSDTAAAGMRLGWLRDFAAIPDGAHQALSAFRSRTHGAQAAVGYGKAAMVFFMLRDALGNDVFDRALQRFWLKHRFTVASWSHLQASFEEASGKTLGGFFRQWLDRAGGPEIAIVNALASEHEGKSKLIITLEQKAPAYVLDVPVEIVSKDKREVRWLRSEREWATEVLELGSTAESVRLDPEFRLWRRLSRRELPPILREWIISGAPALLIAGSDPSGASSSDAAVQSAAERLAQAFFEKPARRIAAASIKESAGPVLIVGLHEAVDQTLAALRLPPRPSALAGSGTTQVWTIDDRTAPHRIAVVSARNAESLSAIMRPLPHYGAQSYLTFEGAKMLTRGVWPADAPAVRVVVSER
jgi:hypothetical protein